MSWLREVCPLIHTREGYGYLDHLRGVGTVGLMFKTSRRVSFWDRLVGSLPNRTFTVLSGSWKSLLPSSTFFLPFLS
jgi:hypothetical protein